MNEVKRIYIITTICEKEEIVILRAERLMAASVEFIKKEAWEEAEVCNDESLRLLRMLTSELLDNREYLNSEIEKN